MSQLTLNSTKTAPRPRTTLDVNDINKQSRFWCFTINNYLAQIAALPPSASYLVSGKEIGDDGTPHLQCYIELTRAARRGSVSKMFPLAWIAIRYATGIEASDYCKKMGDFIEFGQLAEEANSPGKRNDLLVLGEMVNNGSTLAELAQFAPATYMRNYRGLQHYRQITHVPKLHRPDLEVHLYIGKTGLGKSYHARVTLGCFAKPVGKGLWFDGYDRHKAVVIDEFRGQYPLSDFLQITDPFKVQVETKGGHTWFEPDLLVFTTNDSPSTMYLDHTVDTRAAFFRRFTTVLWFYGLRTYRPLTTIEQHEFFQDGTLPSIPQKPMHELALPLKSLVLPGVQPNPPPRKLKRTRAAINLAKDQEDAERHVHPYNPAYAQGPPQPVQSTLNSGWDKWEPDFSIPKKQRAALDEDSQVFTQPILVDCMSTSDDEELAQTQPLYCDETLEDEEDEDDDGASSSSEGSTSDDSD